MSVRTSKLNTWIFALGVAAALGPGCDGANPSAPSPVAPTPTPAPSPTPVTSPTPTPLVIPDSNWQGNTSQRQPMSFTVTANKISSFSIVFWINGRNCHLPFHATPMATIDVDGTFDFSTKGAVVADFTGNFKSTKQMTGTFSVSRLNGPCGVDGPVSASGTYAARRI